MSKEWELEQVQQYVDLTRAYELSLNAWYGLKALIRFSRVAAPLRDSFPPGLLASVQALPPLEPLHAQFKEQTEFLAAMLLVREEQMALPEWLCMDCDRVLQLMTDGLAASLEEAAALYRSEQDALVENLLRFSPEPKKP